MAKQFMEDPPTEVNLRDDMHDVIILPKVRKSGEATSPSRRPVFRFPILRTNDADTNRSAGEYDPPQKLGPEESGGRKARSLAAPDEDFGPAFAVAPTRPEPAAQNGTCIIVNQEHIRVRNVWTAARLSAEPGEAASGPFEPDEYKAELPDLDREVGFELLVAANHGIVYHARGDGAPIPLADLGNESEIWYQLRNGFIAGSVYCRQLKRVLPMVNVAALKKVEA
jgi:hypothetical protein